MNLLRAVRACVVTLAALTLCSCAAEPDVVPAVAEPSSPVSESSGVSRVRVVNDSPTEIAGLHLLFPEDDVAVGDVAAGATSGYVVVPRGVYNYSAFRLLRDGESVVQPVIDFVGESPLPVDDYTYVLGVASDSSERLELLSVMAADPVAAGTADAGVFWVRVSNQGPDDLTGYTMRFADGQEFYLGSIPAGATTQYTRLYAEHLQRPVTVKYSENGRTITEREPGSSDAEQPSGSTGAGSFTYVIGYDRSAPSGGRIEQLRVVADAAP